MRPELARAIVVTLGAALAIAGTAHAQGGPGAKGVIHKISERGETYEDLAEHYYGRRYLALHLRLFNRRAEPLAKGTSIIIPTWVTVPAKRGQTLEQLAELHLSDAIRADYLAELHGLKGGERTLPPAGTRIAVVPSLRHPVRPGESLKTIARLYYRDANPRRLKLLMAFNGLASPALKPSMLLRIPLDEPEFEASAVAARAKRAFARGAPVEVAEADPKPAATAKKRPRPRFERPAGREGEQDDGAFDGVKLADPATAADAGDAEREALDRTCDDGEWAACEAGARRLFDALGPERSAVRVEVLHLRAVALVALGRADDARETFRRLLQLDPEYDLDLYRTSPKILEVFQAVAER
ncbi:LysM peptidoglycan-binding domain-containing protein [Myxococcota bacterium]|nr:LysM peptidoglycan-binding domain-containing protein [Myxococcota bacterium]